MSKQGWPLNFFFWGVYRLFPTDIRCVLSWPSGLSVFPEPHCCGYVSAVTQLFTFLQEQHELLKVKICVLVILESLWHFAPRDYSLNIYLTNMWRNLWGAFTWQRYKKTGKNFHPFTPEISVLLLMVSYGETQVTGCWHIVCGLLPFGSFFPSNNISLQLISVMRCFRLEGRNINFKLTLLHFF